MRISDWSSDVCSSDLAGYDYMAGLEVEFHVFKLVDPKLAPTDAGQPGNPPEVSLLTQGYQYLTEQRYDQYDRSEEHTSELQSLMRNSYAVFCLKKKHHKHIHPLPTATPLPYTAPSPHPDLASPHPLTHPQTPS